MSKHLPGTAKLTRLALLVAIMITMTLALTACDNSEKVIKEGIEQELASIKDPNSDVTGQLLSSMQAYQSMGVDPDEFLNSWLEGYDYKIGAVKVTDKTATVEVEITIKQFGPVVDQVMNQLTAMSEDPSWAQMSQSQRIDKVGQVFMDAIKNASPTTTSLTMDCVLNGNTWEPAPSAEDELYEALVGPSENI